MPKGAGYWFQVGCPNLEDFRMRTVNTEPYSRKPVQLCHMAAVNISAVPLVCLLLLGPEDAHEPRPGWKSQGSSQGADGAGSGTECCHCLVCMEIPRSGSLQLQQSVRDAFSLESLLFQKHAEKQEACEIPVCSTYSSFHSALSSAPLSTMPSW